MALVRDLSDATNLLTCLNEAHPSIQMAAFKPAFTERKQIKASSCITKAMLTAGTSGRLPRTMLDRAKRLSSTEDFLLQECKNIKWIFLKLKYPEKLIDSAINRLQRPTDPIQTPSDSPVRITLPFKD